MAADAYINSRVTAETKALVRKLAVHKGITEAVLVRQVLSAVLETAAVGRLPDPPAVKARDNRVYVTLADEDLVLLRERSWARHMPPATYLATLARAHLRQVTPLPKDELVVLRRAVAELGAIGRNLNQVTRAANRGERGGGLSRGDFAAFLKVAEALRDYIRELLKANHARWRTHAESHD